MVWVRTRGGEVQFGEFVYRGAEFLLKIADTGMVSLSCRCWWIEVGFTIVLDCLVHRITSVGLSSCEGHAVLGVNSRMRAARETVAMMDK